MQAEGDTRALWTLRSWQEEGLRTPYLPALGLEEVLQWVRFHLSTYST